MPTVLIDNDILAKCSVYALTEEMVEALSITKREVGVLGSAQFVLNPHRLKTAADGGATAYKRLAEFLKATEIVEPDETETTLATQLERVAIQMNVQLDVGESQLCAIAIIRSVNMLCTGDKRAIRAIEQLRKGTEQLKALDHKLVCLEAIIKLIIGSRGHLFVRNKICASRGTDKALDICFQCHNTSAIASEIDEGIRSYLRTLAAQAPNATAPN